MSKQTAVRLPDEIHARLQQLAARTGRTATFYIREAIEEHLDDLEDLYLAERVSRRMKEGKNRTYSLEEVEQSGNLSAVESQEARAKKWKLENADALASSNEWVISNGLPLDQFRQF